MLQREEFPLFLLELSPIIFGSWFESARQLLSVAFFSEWWMGQSVKGVFLYAPAFFEYMDYQRI